VAGCVEHDYEAKGCKMAKYASVLVSEEGLCFSETVNFLRSSVSNRFTHHISTTQTNRSMPLMMSRVTTVSHI